MMMGKLGRKGIKTEVLWTKWGGEAIRLVQGGDEKPLMGKDTPVQLHSISYKGLFLLGWHPSEQVVGQRRHTLRFPVPLCHQGLSPVEVRSP